MKLSRIGSENLFLVQFSVQLTFDSLTITLISNQFIIFANLRCQWFQQTQRAVVKVHTIYTFHLQQHKSVNRYSSAVVCLARLLMQCAVLVLLLLFLQKKIAQNKR